MGPRRLLFVDCTLNGVSICVLVDLGATHNFLAVREAQWLNLQLFTTNNRVKMVNTLVMSTVGLAKGVTTRVRQWCD